MNYQSLSLNGTWKMSYIQGTYTDESLPVLEDAADIENAVPAYWEDMTEKFQMTPFFRNLRVNPEYGIQRYPLSSYAPDLALPNIMGTFFYSRSFLWEGELTNAQIHFGGVQNAVSVWLNGSWLGRHVGYSTPFAMEIPAGVLKSGENEIVLCVSNSKLIGFGGEIISGITNRAASQYAGGIYGDVQVRAYCQYLRDAAVLVAPDCKSVEVQLDAEAGHEFTWQVLDGDKCLLSGSCNGDFSFSTDGLSLWSPEDPKCYVLRVACENCYLERTFGVRRLTVNGMQMVFNGEPCYLRGICEHCYYPMTVNPSRDVQYYRNVISKLKELGFNFIRFHTHVPPEEYMQAADEMGILIEVESPNYVMADEWDLIVEMCRKHVSVVMYCCGNEKQLDDPMIQRLRECAQVVHSKTDALFSPYSALRGLEYWLVEPERRAKQIEEPFRHDPERFATVGEYADVYNSYTLGLTSYISLNADPETLDSWGEIYGKPRLSHEICINGTYTDLSLKSRYEGTRVGATAMFTSLEKHLASKGLLERAPLYFKNSCQWQRRVRKHCFEAVRRCKTLAGYDFLGPIDTHWHTFGYDVGMMNEFYELKPGETLRNVQMYNAPTILMTDLGTNFNFPSGSTLAFGLFVSHFGAQDLKNCRCNVQLLQKDSCLWEKQYAVSDIARGAVDQLLDVELPLPDSGKPEAYVLYAALESDGTVAENQWEIYTFPTAQLPPQGDLVISDGMSREELVATLEQGKDVLLLSAEPFAAIPTTFQIALAGRTSGNLATVIAEHPLMDAMPHEGFCGWQFRQLMEGGKAVWFESDRVPFHPIVEVVSSHKNAMRQAALFELRALKGRLLVCGLHLDPADPAAQWLKAQLIAYATSQAFQPKDAIDAEQLQLLLDTVAPPAETVTNYAYNPNDN